MADMLSTVASGFRSIILRFTVTIKGLLKSQVALAMQLPLSVSYISSKSGQFCPFCSTDFLADRKT